MEEKRIEQKLVKMTSQSGGVALKFVSPGCAGVPDRLVLMPGGKAAFVEVKAPGRKPRPLQIRRISQLRRLGFRVFVFRAEFNVPPVWSLLDMDVAPFF